jgi:hypothetical protein
MKTNLRKLMAITASVVLLVSLMAIGTFSASAARTPKASASAKPLFLRAA